MLIICNIYSCLAGNMIHMYYWMLHVWDNNISRVTYLVFLVTGLLDFGCSGVIYLYQKV